MNILVPRPIMWKSGSKSCCMSLLFFKLGKLNCHNNVSGSEAAASLQSLGEVKIMNLCYQVSSHHSGSGLCGFFQPKTWTVFAPERLKAESLVKKPLRCGSIPVTQLFPSYVSLPVPSFTAKPPAAETARSRLASWMIQIFYAGGTVINITWITFCQIG